jgi:hypothetical protein
LKLKMMVAIAGLAALALSSGSAYAGNGDKATGGGQILFSQSDLKASTIAFTAQGTTSTAKGQVQVIDRSAGGGQNATKYHGIVNCIEVTDNTAVIGGYQRGHADNEFTLRVIDNGEPNQGNDMIMLDRESDKTQCGEDKQQCNPDVSLARGNAQVRDGDSTNPAESSSSTMSFKRALTLAGMQ